MNYEDEEYVRVYSRDTATTRRIGWEGRTVLWHLLRVLPKSGALELEPDDDAAETVAALCDLPIELTKIGLERLASRGVTRRHEKFLLVTHFVEAQNARRSDRLRAQDYRDRQRAELSTNADNMPLASRRVTARHDSSLPASPLPSPLPSPALPCLAKDTAIVESTLDATERDISEDDLNSFAPKPPPVEDAHCRHQDAIKRVFEAWATLTGHPGAKRDKKRMARIGARLRDGFTEEQLIVAIRNRVNDPWLMGSGGRVYDGVEVLLRDVAQVERLMALTAPLRPQAQVVRPDPRNEAQDRNAEHDARQRLRELQLAKKRREAFEKMTAERQAANGQ